MDLGTLLIAAVPSVASGVVAYYVRASEFTRRHGAAELLRVAAETKDCAEMARQAAQVAARAAKRVQAELVRKLDKERAKVARLEAGKRR